MLESFHSATTSKMVWRLLATVFLLTQSGCCSGDRSCVSGVCKVNANGTHLLQTKRTASLVSDLPTDGVENPPMCDYLAQDDCEQIVLCEWGMDVGKCHPKVAWLHIQKAGGSFGTTLAHYANSSLPKEAKMNTSSQDTIMGEKIFFCYEYPLDVWFQNVFWVNSSQRCNAGDHADINDAAWEQWKGKFFGMFRQPEERMVSSYNWFADGKGTQDIVSYAQRHKGLQTKVLSGRKSILSEQDRLHVALDRLRTGFAFVGLTSEWDLSICLFHKMFGGECLPVEFENMRHGNTSDSEKDSDLETLQADPDLDDGEVYRVASEMFWTNVRKYDVRRSTCQQTCSAVAHIFQAAVEDESSGALLMQRHAGDGQAFEYQWPGRYVYNDF